MCLKVLFLGQCLSVSRMCEDEGNGIASGETGEILKWLGPAKNVLAGFFSIVDHGYL